MKKLFAFIFTIGLIILAVNGFCLGTFKYHFNYYPLDKSLWVVDYKFSDGDYFIRKKCPYCGTWLSFLVDRDFKFGGKP